MRAKVFIGSSSSKKSLNVAYAVQTNLDHDTEATVWTQDIFNLSSTNIESLEDIVDKSDFGIFVFHPDDILKINNKESFTVRDNVLFEFGMFLGRLGRGRVFIIVPRNEKIHLATDLLGIVLGDYDPHRSDNNMERATGPFCNKILNIINVLGPFKKNQLSQFSVVTSNTPEVYAETDDYFDLFKYNEDKAVYSKAATSDSLIFWGSTLEAHTNRLLQIIRKNINSIKSVKFLLLEPDSISIKMAVFRAGMSEEQGNSMNETLAKNLKKIFKLKQSLQDSEKKCEIQIECRTINYLAPYTLYLFDADIYKKNSFASLMLQMSSFREQDTIKHRPSIVMHKSTNKYIYRYLYQQFCKCWNVAKEYTHIK